ncbi:Uma2 family endonuclease [Isosphaeraceae bacterium EP7]
MNVTTLQETEIEPISLDLAGTLMTPEEFDSAEDWDEFYAYELIGGVLIVSPSPSPMERGSTDFLGTILNLYQWQHPQGSALDATLPEHTIRSGRNRRRADRAIWAGLGRMPDPLNDIPTIAVEIVSRGRRNRQRDYVEKRVEYLAAGVREYWVIDRYRRTMTVFLAGEEKVVAEPETYRTPLLPGFELILAKLLAESDRWTDRES